MILIYLYNNLPFFFQGANQQTAGEGDCERVLFALPWPAGVWILDLFSFIPGYRLIYFH